MFNDFISIQRISLLEPSFRSSVKAFYSKLCDIFQYNIRVTCSYRSFQEQSVLYNQGRSFPGPIVTYARPGYSYHNYSLAIDICNIIDNKISYIFDWDILADTAKNNGITWGGLFTKQDRLHFQVSPGISFDILRKDYPKGVFYN